MADDPVTLALSQARFNDIVTLELNGGDTEQTVSLVASLDTGNGGIQWNQSTESVSRHLRTKRWIFPMLNDKDRNLMYMESIKKIMNSLSGRQSIQALDIGTGTGLLAMMMARESSACRVAAVEMDSNMAKIAERTIHDNNLSSQITVYSQHSTELPSVRADVCTSELLEDGLLGEGWLPAMRDAWKRHLKKDALVVPQKARVFVQAVQCDAWKRSVFDQSPCSELLTNASHEYPIRIPIQARALVSSKQLKFLSKPTELFSLSVQSLAEMPPEDGESVTRCLSIDETGTVNGVIVWWELDLTEDITYSLSPSNDSTSFQDHWHHILYLQTNKFTVQTNDSLEVKAFHDDYDIRVEYRRKLNVDSESKRMKFSEEVSTCNFSAKRCLELENAERFSLWNSAIESETKSASVILDTSDFGIFGMVAALHTPEHGPRVVSVETSLGQLATEAACLANQNLMSRPGCRFEILQCHWENLNIEALGGQLVDVVLAEPYYESLHDHTLESALNTFYICRGLRRRSLTKPDVTIIPAKCRIIAVAIESEELRSAYSRCGGEDEKIAGLNHSYVNSQIDFSSFNLSLDLKQFKHRKMSEPWCVAELDFASDNDACLGQVSTSSTLLDGRCDLLALHVEYALTKEISYSTSSDDSQAIRMLPSFFVEPGSPTQIRCSFKAGDPNDSHSLACEFVGQETNQ